MGLRAASRGVQRRGVERREAGQFLGIGRPSQEKVSQLRALLQETLGEPNSKVQETLRKLQETSEPRRYGVLATLNLHPPYREQEYRAFVTCACAPLPSADISEDQTTDTPKPAKKNPQGGGSCATRAKPVQRKEGAAQATF